MIKHLRPPGDWRLWFQPKAGGLQSLCLLTPPCFQLCHPWGSSTLHPVLEHSAEVWQSCGQVQHLHGLDEALSTVRRKALWTSVTLTE